MDHAKSKTPLQRAKAPWHLYLAGIFFFFLYANGIYDYFMTLGHNDAYYSSKNYGEEVYTYFTDYLFCLSSSGP